MGGVQDTYGQISRATGIIIGLTLVDKVLAFAKEMLTAHRFGVSGDLDAFNIALAFPGVTILFLSGAVVSATVPLYLEWSSRSSVPEANRRAIQLFYALALFFAGAAVIGYAFSPFLIGFMGYGFEPREKELAVGLLRLMVWVIFLDGAGIMLRGMLQARKSFFGLSVAPTFVNCLIIAMLLFGRGLGIHALAYGTLLGTFCRTAYMLAVLCREGVSFAPKGLPGTGTIAPFLGLVLPLIGSELMSNSNLLVDQAMATQLSSGSVSALRYAYRINDLPVQVVIMAISRSIFPFVAEQTIANDRTPLRRLFKHSVIVLAFLTFPLIGFTVLFSEEIVSLLLQRGAFETGATRETARILACYSCGLFFYAYTFVNGTFFSAMRDTKSLFAMALLSVVLNIAFNVLFMRLFGVMGIALSTTATFGILSAAFILLLIRRLQFDEFGDLCRCLLRLGLAAITIAAMGYGIRHLSRSLGIHSIVYLPVAGLFLSIAYLVAVRVVATKEIHSSLGLLISPERIPKWVGFLLGAPPER